MIKIPREAIPVKQRWDTIGNVLRVRIGQERANRTARKSQLKVGRYLSLASQLQGTVLV